MDYDLIALRNQLVTAFSDDELRDLCLEMRVDYEIIDGTNKSAKARELLTYLHRRTRIDQLLLLCQQERPTYQWDFVRSQESQSEEFRQQLQLDRSLRAKFQDLKFEAYRDVWQKLYALKVAGDELWNYISKENLLNFATIYQQTNAVVMLNALLFEDEDFKSLQSILATFGDFQAGKLQLARFRATDPEHEDAFQMRRSGWEHVSVSRQIAKNKGVKAAYDALLNEISTAFRLRVIQIVT